ncbi:sulfotransferase, partial [bacterium]|nr:sulfotransferase [bacterium]
MKKPVFIIALHRTGSTMVSNMLNLNPDLAMAPDEMHFSTPWHKDFLYHAKKAGNLNNDRTVINFVKTIFSNNLYGSFWRELSHTKIDKNRIIKRILRSNRSTKEILTIILEEYAKSEGKNRFGAKYPVHFSKIATLFRWWPDCKVIHLVRDPRAVCASKVNDVATKSRKSKYSLLNRFIHFGTELFFVIEFIWSSRVHEQCKSKRNYLKIRFEDLLINPIPCVKELCDFCEIKSHPAMMYPLGKPSSYDDRQR